MSISNCGDVAAWQVPIDEVLLVGSVGGAGGSSKSIEPDGSAMWIADN
jgi:hypothetical protein